jgi:hypothetical protein
MNTVLHPDTLYELNRDYQNERRQESQRVRPFHKPHTPQNHLKDRLFLLSGNLLVTAGNNLRSRAVQPAIVNVELCGRC